MPISVPYTWSQTDSSITITARIPLTDHTQTLTKHNCSVVISPVYIKLSHPPCLLDIDLLHPVDVSSPSVSVHGDSRAVVLTLHKANKDLLWEDITVSVVQSSNKKKSTKQWLMKRREESLQQAELIAQQLSSQVAANRLSNRQRDRERGWEHDRQRKEERRQAMNQERVVSIQDLQRWTQHREERKQQISQEEEQQQEEHTDTQIYAHTETHPPAQGIPVRTAFTVNTQFTAVHPTFESLPARNMRSDTSPTPPPAVSTASLFSHSIHQLLSLKDKADRVYKAGDTQSAIHLYSVLLDNSELSVCAGSSPSHSSLLCRLYGNRSACYFSLCSRSSLSATAEHLSNLLLTKRDCVSALSFLSGLTAEEQIKMEIKTRRRLASVSHRLQDYTMEMQQYQILQQLVPRQDTTHQESIEDIRQAIAHLTDTAAAFAAKQHVTLYEQSIHSTTERETSKHMMDQALRIAPLYIPALHYRAHIHLQEQAWLEACRDLIMAVSILKQPDAQQEQPAATLHRLLYDRAECYYHMKHYTAAQTDIREAIDLFSSTSESTASLGCDRIHTMDNMQRQLIIINRQHSMQAALSAIKQHQQHKQWPEMGASIEHAIQLHSLCHTTTTKNDFQPCFPCAEREWTLTMCALMSSYAHAAFMSKQYTQTVQTTQRALHIWKQWTNSSCHSHSHIHTYTERGDNTDSEQKMLLVTLAKQGAALCYMGQLSLGHDAYAQMHMILEQRVSNKDPQTQEQAKMQMQEVQTDMEKIERSMREHGITRERTLH